MRRKVAMKRTVFELEKYKELYYQILEIIRTEDQALLGHFLTAVRSVDSLDDIAAIIPISLQGLKHREMRSSSPVSPVSEDTASSIEQSECRSSHRSEHTYMTLEHLCGLPVRGT